VHGVSSSLQTIPEEQNFQRGSTGLMCAELNVQEILLPRGGTYLLQPATKALLKGLLPGARISLQPGSRWNTAALKTGDLLGMFPTGGVPVVLRRYLDDEARHSAALAAFAGMFAFLQASLLDKAVFSAHCVEELYPQAPETPAKVGAGADTDMVGGERDAAGHLVLDGAALSNLEVPSCLCGACAPCHLFLTMKINHSSWMLALCCFALIAHHTTEPTPTPREGQQTFRGQLRVKCLMHCPPAVPP
jgi:hypothetical protein